MLSNIQPKTRKRNSEDDLIPLINIVFLLLTFFMIAGQIRAIFGDQVSLPHTVNNQPEVQAGNVLSVQASAELMFNQDSISLEKLAEMLQLSDINQAPLRVRADKNLTAKQLEPVFALLRQYPPESVVLYSLQEAKL